MNRTQAILAILRGEVDLVEAGEDRYRHLVNREAERLSERERLRQHADQYHPELIFAAARRARALR